MTLHLLLKTLKNISMQINKRQSKNSKQTETNQLKRFRIFEAIEQFMK
jgi:hypothetical protein